MLTFGSFGQNYTLDPLALLIAALILDACFGDMKFLFKFIKHPIAFIGQIIGALDRKLNRE